MVSFEKFELPVFCTCKNRLVFAVNCRCAHTKGDEIKVQLQSSTSAPRGGGGRLLPVTSSLLDTDILLSTLLSKIPRLRSSLNVTDQLSHTYVHTHSHTHFISPLQCLKGRVQHVKLSVLQSKLDQ